MVRLEKEHRETTQLLVEQNRNLRKISFQDLDRRRIAEDLHEELEKATLNCLVVVLTLRQILLVDSRLLCLKLLRNWNRQSIKTKC